MSTGKKRDHPKAETLLLHHISDDVIPVSPVTPDRPQPSKHPIRWTSMEEIEDESIEAHRNRPKSQRHLLVAIDDDDDVADVLLEPSQNWQSSTEESEFKQALHSETDTKDKAPTEAHTPGITLPPPSKEEPFHLKKKRFTPAGTSAIGVSVLSTKGWVGNLENSMVDLRLDSCVDVTLISEDFFRLLKGAPKERQGMRMQLWQLTNKDSSLKGFVCIPITMQSEGGTLLESKAEAYIVLGMTVPILLGEDYQLNYKVGVTRNVEMGTHIHFAGTDFRVPGQRVEWMTDFGRRRQSALTAGHFIRAKLHRRAKVKRCRQRQKFGIEEKMVQASEDVHLRPHECKCVRVEGQLGEDKEWLVQKNLLANANNSHFVVPNTLISAKDPWVHIANPTEQPRYICKG